MNQSIGPRIVSNRAELPAEAVYTDSYPSALKELFSIENPGLRREDPNRAGLLEEFINNSTIPERYVYYPWRNQVVRTVDESTYFKLRTARNRTIITEAEQRAYRQVKIGIAGMSVGSAAVRALAASGGPAHIKIADFDSLEITNLNRISAGLPDVGKHKADLVAQYVWELDPDAQLEVWRDGITTDTVEAFLCAPKLDIFIDEMDDLVLKFQARELCKKAGIPVLMATDNGDSVILDVERFDLEPNREVFHGLVPDITLDAIRSLPFQAWVQVATKIVGPEYLTTRMQGAIMEIGRTIPAVPQLGPTASMAGAGIAFAVRQISTKQPLPSGRYLYGLDEPLVPGYTSDEAKALRAATAERMRQRFSAKPE